MPQCQGTTQAGERCRRTARADSKFCSIHAPSREKASEVPRGPTPGAERAEADELLHVALAIIAAGALLWGLKLFGKWLPRLG